MQYAEAAARGVMIGVLLLLLLLLLLPWNNFFNSKAPKAIETGIKWHI
jgi:hypothetical protein